MELDSLHKDDFVRILTETECSLVRQYQMMLDTEGVSLVFETDAVSKIAEICERVNTESEDIGARRLHTIMEYLLENVAFTAPERQGEKIVITPEFIEEHLTGIVEHQNLNQYIL